MSEKQLARSMEDRRIAGVASGLANYLNVDPAFIRLAFVLSVILLHGFGFLVYILLWILMPEQTLVGKVLD